MQNNKFMKYGAVAVVLTALFLVSISTGIWPKVPISEGVPQSGENLMRLSIMLDYGNGKIETYTDLTATKNETVFGLLKQITEKNKIELKYKDYGGDMGVFVESIGGAGVDPSGKKWWQYWVNNKYSQVGMSSYRIHSGDVIALKFAQGQI